MEGRRLALVPVVAGVIAKGLGSTLSGKDSPVLGPPLSMLILEFETDAPGGLPGFRIFKDAVRHCGTGLLAVIQGADQSCHPMTI